MVNNKSYIGFDSKYPKRISEHKKASFSEDTVFYRAIRKYGWENFEWSILFQSKDKHYTKDVMENHFITEYNTYIHFNECMGYNMTLGGDGTLGNKQSEETKIKRLKTNIINWGCEHPIQSSEIKEKSKQTCLEKYGYSHPRMNQEIKEKSKQTCLEKYGVDNPSKYELIKEKIQKTNLEKYGMSSPLQVEKLKQKCGKEGENTNALTVKNIKIINLSNMI